MESLDPKESTALDLSRKMTFFCGNNAHGVQPFQGDRFSLVFFTTSKFWKIKDKDVDTLKSLGFQVPTEKSMEKVKKAITELDVARAKGL